MFARNASSRHASNGFALVEDLEVRRMMAFTPIAAMAQPVIGPIQPPSPIQMSNGVVRVRGTSGPDMVRAFGETVNGVPMINFNMNGTMKSFDARTISSIEVRAFAGRDFIDLHGLNTPATVWGGADTDTVQGTEAGDFLWAGEDGVATAIAGDDEIHGLGGDDILVGDNGADRLFGDGGFDRIYGQGNNDYLSGGFGDDYIDAGDGDDRVYGDDGNDYLRGGNQNDLIYGGVGNDSIYGGLGDDYMYGYSGNDSIWGEGGNDSLDGGAGNDHLDGGDGDDSFWAQDGQEDQIYGGSGWDRAIRDARNVDGYTIWAGVAVPVIGGVAEYYSQCSDSISGIEQDSH